MWIKALKNSILEMKASENGYWQHVWPFRHMDRGVLESEWTLLPCRPLTAWSRVCQHVCHSPELWPLPRSRWNEWESFALAARPPSAVDSAGKSKELSTQESCSAACTKTRARWKHTGDFQPGHNYFSRWCHKITALQFEWNIMCQTGDIWTRVPWQAVDPTESLKLFKVLCQ